MAYNATYTTDDVDDIAIDGIGTAGAEIVNYVALIVIAVFWTWLTLKVVRLDRESRKG